MQRQVVKNGEDAGSLQMLDQPLAHPERGQQHVKHVVGLLAMLRHDREAHVVYHGPVLKMLVVIIPNALPLRLNLLAGLELGIQESGEHLRWKITGAQVNPGVLVYLAAEEAAAVGAFLPDNLRALHVNRVVYEERATLTADKVLGLVEALGGER